MNRICLFLVSVLLTSCFKTEHKYEHEISWEWSDIKETRKLKSTVFLDEEDVYMPIDLEIYKNHLITLDIGGDDGFFQVFDLNTKKKIGGKIEKGNGPLEMLSPRFVKGTKEHIAVWDMQTSIIHKYHLNEFIDSIFLKPFETIKLNKKGYSNLSIIDKGFISQLYDKNNQLCKYDTEGNEIFHFAKYPSHRELNYNEIIKRDAYYMNFVSNESSKIALCYSMTDLIDIYDMNGGLKKRLHGPDNFIPHFKQINSNKIEGARPIGEKSKDAFFAPKNHGNYFSVMYNGRSLNEENHNSSCDKILIFSWDGVPLICYQLDKKIISYAFDEENKKIYAVATDPEFMILEYDYQ